MAGAGRLRDVADKCVDKFLALLNALVKKVRCLARWMEKRDSSVGSTDGALLDPAALQGEVRSPANLLLAPLLAQ